MSGSRTVMLAGALTLCVPATPGQEVSYWRDVHPILQVHCVGCHQPAKIEGGLVLASHRHVMAGLEGEEPVVVPGEPEQSLLLQVVLPTDGNPPAMPGEGNPLSSEQSDVLRRWIAAGAGDDSPPSQGPLFTAERPPEYQQPPVITGLDFSPDGELLAVTGYHEVLLHRSDGQGLVARLVGLGERPESVAFSPDGALLAVAGGSPARLGELQVWDVRLRELVHSVPVTHDSLFGASWSPDGQLVAFGASDTAVRAIHALTGDQVLFNGAHNDWVLDTVFASDGSHLVTVSRDRSMKLIQVVEQQFIDNITSITPGALKGGLMAVARHPTRDELLVGGADGIPKIYRMYREKARRIGDDYNLIRAFAGLPGRVFDVEFAADGERLVAGSSASEGGQVRMYRVADGEQLWSHSAAAGVFAVAIHPDGSRVACGGFDGQVWLLDAVTGEVVHRFTPVPLTAAQSGTEAKAERTSAEREE